MLVQENWYTVVCMVHHVIYYPGTHMHITYYNAVFFHMLELQTALFPDQHLPLTLELQVTNTIISEY